MLETATSRAHRIDAAIAAVALGLFALLTIWVMAGTADTLDAEIRSLIHSWATPTLTAVTQALTELGSVRVLLALCALCLAALWFSGRLRLGLSLAITLVTTMLANTLLKLIIHRARPEAYFGVAPDSSSFPSGHSAFSCCFYFGAAMIGASFARTRQERIAIYACAALLVAAIGFSRVYLGVHYPTDVLGGYLVAIAVIALARIAGFQPGRIMGTRRP